MVKPSVKLFLLENLKTNILQQDVLKVMLIFGLPLIILINFLHFSILMQTKRLLLLCNHHLQSPNQLLLLKKLKSLMKTEMRLLRKKKNNPKKKRNLRRRKSLNLLDQLLQNLLVLQFLQKKIE